MTRHPLSIAGALLTTVSAVVFLFVLFLDLFGFHTNPYVGLIFFVILPTLFVARSADDPDGDRAGAAAPEARAGASPYAADRLERSPSPAGRRPRPRADHRQSADRVVGGVSRRRIHGYDGVLRAGLSHGHGTGVRGAPRGSAFARHVRQMPCRVGCAVVRLLQVERAPSAGPPGSGQLSATGSIASLQSPSGN